MSSVDIGHKAELAASVYLEMRGYQVLERNWRRPRSEIDIIASKDGAIHFVEVKYRRNDEQGSGWDAITPTKLLHMRRAAWAWVDENEYRGEYVLSAVEIAGPELTVIGFIENVI